MVKMKMPGISAASYHTIDDSHSAMRSGRNRTLNQVPEVGLTMEIMSRNEVSFLSLVTSESSMFLIREGLMTVEAKDMAWEARPGEFILLQAGIPLNITHQPSGRGVHQATGLFWARQVISGIAPSTEACLKEPAYVLGERDGRFHDSFISACRALSGTDHLPPAVAASRIREVLIWLSLSSLFFLPAENKTLSYRLRSLLELTPGAGWTERQACGALGQSPATLRRRLAAENTSFREILTDARMLYALRLLHSTDQPIGNIARDSGYNCPSSFTKRFCQRFGFHPSSLRGHQRKWPALS